MSSRWTSRFIAFFRRIDPRRDKIPRGSSSSLVLIIIANGKKAGGPSRSFFRGHGRPGLRDERIFFISFFNGIRPTLYSSHETGKFLTSWTSLPLPRQRTAGDCRWISLCDNARLNDIQRWTRSSLLYRIVPPFRYAEAKWNSSLSCVPRKVAVPRDAVYREWFYRGRTTATFLHHL